MSTDNAMDPVWALYYRWRRLEHAVNEDANLPFAGGIFKRFAEELKVALEQRATPERGTPK